MGLFRALLIASVSVSLLACGSGDEDEYTGAPPLSESQSLKVTSAMGHLDQVQRALDERIFPKKEKDQDILDLVELLKICTAEAGGEVDSGGKYTGYAELSGEACPVNYRYDSEHIKAGEILQSGEEHYSYSSDNQEILSLIGISSVAINLFYNISGGYTLTGRFQSGSFGVISLNDLLTVSELGSSIKRYNFFRKINIDGFLVEARVLWDVDWSEGTGQLVDQKYVINGKFVSAEAVYSIYKIPFSWFEQGKRFENPKP